MVYIANEQDIPHELEEKIITFVEDNMDEFYGLYGASRAISDMTEVNLYIAEFWKKIEEVEFEWIIEYCPDIELMELLEEILLEKYLIDKIAEYEKDNE